MTDADSTKRIEAGLLAEARGWFVRRLEAPSTAEEAAFRQWREADPVHDRMYRQVEETWQAVGQPGQRIADEEADELAVYLRAMDRAKAERKAFRRLAASCLVLLALVGGGIWLEKPNLLQNLAADYATGRGERRSLALPDGTRVLLDADSAIDERFGATERRIILLRGSASFDVAPGKQPFIVRAANGEIRDIGTRFDVSLSEDGGSVTLENGQVAITVDRAARATLLEPGQHIRFDRSGLGPVERVDLADALAWRTGRYTFYRARLADVVAAISRYRRGRIVLTSATLGGQIVTGSFSLADTDAALASLQSSVGFRMISLTPALTILASK